MGLPGPEPKRPRGPPSRQRRFEEAIYKAIRENTLPSDIGSSVVPSWWRPGDSFVREEETMVAEACSFGGANSVAEGTQDDDDQKTEGVKGTKRKHHWAAPEVKEWMCELIDYKT